MFWGCLHYSISLPRKAHLSEKSPTPSLSSSLIHSALLSPHWSGLPSVEMKNDRLSSLIFNIAYIQRSLLSYSSTLYLQTYDKGWTSRFSRGRILILPASWQIEYLLSAPQGSLSFLSTALPHAHPMRSKGDSIPRFNPVMRVSFAAGMNKWPKLASKDLST